jgi:cysteine synthase A
VIDPNISPLSKKLMEIYGAEIRQVTKKDKSGGYLSTRIELIEKLIAMDKNIVWTNQYASKANIDAHYNTTAKEILSQIKAVDYLFVGAGTTGTLTGCAQYFKEYSSNTKIIAVDAKGSVTFGYPPATRYIPGLGTSKKPPICSTDNVFDILLIEEDDTIRMCHYLLKKYGLFLGGSSGTVLEAIRRYSDKISPNLVIVAISPDFGDKYLDTIYNYEWVKDKYGLDLMQEIKNESKLFNYYS